MRLVYTKTGVEVKVGDEVEIKLGGEPVMVRVEEFRKPTSPASEGRVTVYVDEDGYGRDYYVSLIGAKWIEREDRAVVLESWAGVRRDDNLILTVSPEQANALRGDVCGHQDFIEGDSVITSLVMKAWNLDGCAFVLTRSGTVYQLSTTESVYLERFPDAREALMAKFSLQTATVSG